MNFTRLNDTCYYFDAPVNIGYIHQGNEGMLIDAGIDSSTMKKVLHILTEHNLPITHLFITHAHADHYGGAKYLQTHQSITTIAPKFESIIMQYPILEPLYLFGGNDPIRDIRNKFLEGEPIKVDIEVEEGDYQFSTFVGEVMILPGHSYFQAGLLINGIFYAADSYFGTEQLTKHKIPYITDAAKTLRSLDILLELNCEGAVPGHGKFEQTFKKTVQENIRYHENILSDIKYCVGKREAGISHEELVAYMCEKYHVQCHQLSQFLLYRTAVTAYVTALIKKNEIKYNMQRFRWMFYIDEGGG
ncbi:MBL fold metallo-hydrolase [Salirhabdus salicampi]|uniref:MBL fold metallo-hydrolase n=1 Tax=Salirhabdus salicampi TaxID=476102 RepID=UPI0020C401DD|nr:MBL fold metallo-hydrolase [Salirhabdus salicampi]MCP8615607.1 MBL fold metallo-hydrolase [Salirhabdus salicampi]